MAEIKTIYGYPIEDLMFMSALCAKAGITPDEIHEIKDMCSWCYDVISKDFHDSMDKAIQYQIDNMGLECGQDGRTIR